MRRTLVAVAVLALCFACAKSSGTNGQASFNLSGTIVAASPRANVPTVSNEPSSNGPGAPSTDGDISLQTDVPPAPSNLARCRPSPEGSFTIYFDKQTTFRPASIATASGFPANLKNHKARITGTGRIPATVTNGSGCVLIAETVQIGSTVPSGTSGPPKTILPAPTATVGQGSPPSPGVSTTPSVSTLPGD